MQLGNAWPHLPLGENTCLLLWSWGLWVWDRGETGSTSPREHLPCRTTTPLGALRHLRPQYSMISDISLPHYLLSFHPGHDPFCISFSLSSFLLHLFCCSLASVFVRYITCSLISPCFSLLLALPSSSFPSLLLPQKICLPCLPRKMEIRVARDTQTCPQQLRFLD